MFRRDFLKGLGALPVWAAAVAANAGAAAKQQGVNMTLMSSAFTHQSPIPARYTGEGKGVSPPLAWSGVPEAAQSLVLIVDDPDAPDPRAPKVTWVHWVLYNIPVKAVGLSEGVTPARLPVGTCEGLNDWRRKGYGGPMPPVGRHRYFFKLYALDTVLSESGALTKAQVERGMAGHILDKAELVGTYQRGQ